MSKSTKTAKTTSESCKKLDDRYIMIAGMKRSGSTWQANAVRLLCEKAYGEDNVWIGEEYNAKKQAPCTINKVHPYRKDLANVADYVLTSVRDFPDAAESFKRFKGHPPSSELMHRWVQWLLRWNLHAQHMMDFEVLVSPRARKREVFKLAHVLDLKDHLRFSDKQKSFEELEDLEPPEEGHDDRTLMFHNHITQDKFS